MNPLEPHGRAIRTHGPIFYGMLVVNFILLACTIIALLVSISHVNDRVSAVYQARIETCQATNQRHNAAVKYLDSIFDNELRNAKQLSAEQNQTLQHYTHAVMVARVEFRLLITALDPIHTNCVAYAHHPTAGNVKQQLQDASHPR